MGRNHSYTFTTGNNGNIMIGYQRSGVAKDNFSLYFLYSKILKRKYVITDCKSDFENRVHIFYENKYGNGTLILTPK